MLLRICLPSTYPDCSTATRVGRRGLSLLATTLEMILKTTLHNSMGLSLSGVRATSYLGITMIKVVLSAFKIVLSLLESSTTLKMSCFTIFQEALKKSTLNPSEPSALPFCISLRTSLTSSSDTGLLRLKLSS
jgi:hypothetical protein